MSWTKFSERLPTGPFWPGRPGERANVIFNGLGGLDTSEWTHWHPAPEPPESSKEETQADVDEMAFTNWWGNTSCRNLDAFNAWHAALAWERAEVAKLLPELGPDENGCEGLNGSYLEWVGAVKAVLNRGRP